MADVNGSNYQKEFVDIPSDVANIGEYGGRVKVMFDSWSGAAAGDSIYFGKIPAGARILRFVESGGGTAPTLNKNDSGGVSAMAAGDKLSEESDAILITDGGDGAATGFVFVEYLLD